MASFWESLWPASHNPEQTPENEDKKQHSSPQTPGKPLGLEHDQQGPRNLESEHPINTEVVANALGSGEEQENLTATVIPSEKPDLPEAQEALSRDIPVPPDEAKGQTGKHHHGDEDVSLEAKPKETAESRLKPVEEQVQRMEELDEKAIVQEEYWLELKEDGTEVFDGVDPDLYKGEEDVQPEDFQVPPPPPGRGCWSWVWGGPITPRSDQSVMAWAQSFFSTVWTGHGLNQAFHRESGTCRVCFWALLFCAAFAALVWGLLSIFSDFFENPTTIVTSRRTGVDMLPMITICADTPFRCTCDAFYAEEAREQHFHKVLPFICSSLIVLKHDMFPGIDAFLDFQSFTTLEKAATYVDVHLTKLKMVNYSKAQSCDNGAHTGEWFLGRLRASISRDVNGTAAPINNTEVVYDEMLQYAGYHEREQIVRRCETKDFSGRPTSCMSDRYWAAPIMDSERGVCHTLNPCSGIPVGSFCLRDEQCEHVDGPEMAGGYCVLRTETQGECVCNLCSVGEDCRSLRQAQPGRDAASMLVLHGGVDKSWGSVLSGRDATASEGPRVFAHAQHSRGLLEAEIVASGGKMTDLAFSAVAEVSVSYPFSNCSESAVPDPSLCRLRCLRREQAEKCCGLAIPAIERGRLPAIAFNNSVGVVRLLDDPTMGCDVLNASVRACMENQSSLHAQGLICVDGSTGTTARHWWFWEKEGWYDLRSHSTDGALSDQEQESQQVRKHCVWAASYVSAGLERDPNHGSSCESDADCGPRIAENEAGKCVEAVRAFCPANCQQSGFETEVERQQRLARSTVRLLARAELNIVTQARALVDQEARELALQNLTVEEGARRVYPLHDWKPRCATAQIASAGGVGAVGAGAEAGCMTDEQAIELVQSRYGFVRLFLKAFEEDERRVEELLPLPVLLGSVGADLRLFLGVSFMSLFELLELLLLLLLAAPFFCCGVASLPCVKRVPDPEEEGGEEDDDAVAEGKAEPEPTLGSWPAGMQGDIRVAERIKHIRRRPGRTPRDTAPVGLNVSPRAELVTAATEQEPKVEESREQAAAADWEANQGREEEEDEEEERERARVPEQAAGQQRTETYMVLTEREATEARWGSVAVEEDEPLDASQPVILGGGLFHSAGASQAARDHEREQPAPAAASAGATASLWQELRPPPPEAEAAQAAPPEPLAPRPAAAGHAIPRRPRKAGGQPEGFDVARFEEPLPPPGYDPDDPPLPQPEAQAAAGRGAAAGARKRGLLRIADTPEQWQALKHWGREMGPEAIDGLYMTQKRSLNSPLYQSFAGRGVGSDAGGAVGRGPAEPKLYQSAGAVMETAEEAAPEPPPPRAQPTQPGEKTTDSDALVEARKRGSVMSAASAPLGPTQPSNRQALVPPSPLPRVLVVRHSVSRYPGLSSPPATSHSAHRPPPPIAPRRSYPSRSGLGGDAHPRAPSAPQLPRAQTQLLVPVPPPSDASRPARRTVQGGAGPAARGPTYVSFNPAGLSATSLVVPIPQPMPDPRQEQALQQVLAAASRQRAASLREDELPEPEPEPELDVEEQLRRWLGTFPTL